MPAEWEVLIQILSWPNVAQLTCSRGSWCVLQTLQCHWQKVKASFTLNVNKMHKNSKTRQSLFSPKWQRHLAFLQSFIINALSLFLRLHLWGRSVLFCLFVLLSIVWLFGTWDGVDGNENDNDDKNDDDDDDDDEGWLTGNLEERKIFAAIMMPGI